MCGIAGVVSHHKIPTDRLKACLKVMGRRGPDHSALKEWTTRTGQQVALLHSRLKIIDLDDRANQPFAIRGKTMVFNGELYNYPELRNKLKSSGKVFHTDSDTEVLLQTIDSLGWGGLNQCEGMWALAIYDEDAGTLSLCRDRFGEKPLFLYHDDSGIYFGSEVKFIFSLLGHRLKVDREQLYRYLVNGYKSLYKNGHTFFEGLSELPPASLLTLDGEGREITRKYWTPRFEPDESVTYSDAVAGVKERLIQSVKMRLRADVPLAFCMSGGIDSNSLISIAKNVFHYDVHGFTIANTDSRYEEQDMIDHAVYSQNLRHTSIPVSPDDFIEKMCTLIRYHDAPIYTISYFAHWVLMQKIAQNNYKISISGTAADEIFTGYYDHHLAYLYEIRHDHALYAASIGAWTEYVKPVVRNPHLSNPNLFIDDPSFRDHIYLNADQFRDYLTSDWSEPFIETRYTDSLLRNRMMNELYHEAVPVILHEDDLNAMYYSIENRSPFLDRQLVEFCYRVPSVHLMQGGRAKALLRDAMRSIVPQVILENTRKVGFNVPIHDFLKTNDPKTRAYLLDESPIFNHIRRDKIERLLDKTELPNSESKFLFYFLSSKIFMEEFES